MLDCKQPPTSILKNPKCEHKQHKPYTPQHTIIPHTNKLSKRSYNNIKHSQPRSASCTVLPRRETESGSFTGAEKMGLLKRGMKWYCSSFAFGDFCVFVKLCHIAEPEPCAVAASLCVCVCVEKRGSIC